MKADVRGSQMWPELLQREAQPSRTKIQYQSGKSLRSVDISKNVKVCGRKWLN